MRAATALQETARWLQYLFYFIAHETIPLLSKHLIKCSDNDVNILTHRQRLPNTRNVCDYAYSTSIFEKRTSILTCSFLSIRVSSNSAFDASRQKRRQCSAKNSTHMYQEGCQISGCFYFSRQIIKWHYASIKDVISTA